MTHRNPVTALDTHEVTNQPPPFVDQNLFLQDLALREALAAAGAASLEKPLAGFGALCGSSETHTWARQANESPPRLMAFDRYGQRLDEIEFHPAYHQLMALGLDHGIAAHPWHAGSDTGHLQHGAMMILLNQVDAGVTCPMSMSYASMAALQAEPDIYQHWHRKLTASRYDPRFIPPGEKHSVTIGMAMTEKQGGSDVRANTTRAMPTADGAWLLSGHKWFCSAPMSDAFLTLANTEAGITCFLVPRWRPGDQRNGIRIMRLKDKMGDRSNASSEIEYHDAWAQRIGAEGRGIATILAMVQLTRYDCVLGSTGGMRAALTQAIWHTIHRRAFGKKLAEHATMQAVLADLALESEAATALAVRVGAAIQRAGTDEHEAAFARLATPAAKFWICKRQPGMVYEALECHGGAGYVEEGPMPRLFRQSPLNAIWEGSGNVIALDILRCIAREPASVDAVRTELQSVDSDNRQYHAHLRSLQNELDNRAGDERSARHLAQQLALALQAAALRRYAPDYVFEGFCTQRLKGARMGAFYGDLASAILPDQIIERALPADL